MESYPGAKVEHILYLIGLVAEFVDLFLNLLSTKHPSYIKDTYGFISAVRPLAVLPDLLLFSIDVDALYTNIDTRQCLEGVGRILQ